MVMVLKRLLSDNKYFCFLWLTETYSNGDSKAGSKTFLGFKINRKQLFFLLPSLSRMTLNRKSLFSHSSADKLPPFNRVHLTLTPA